MTESAKHDDASFTWLSQSPHDEAHSERQIKGVRDLLAGMSRHVLDLGCGTGRVLKPLVQDGHDVVGLDADASLLEESRHAVSSSSPPVELVCADFFRDRWPTHTKRNGAPFDAVLLLGNTLMTVVDVDNAVMLMKRVREALAPSGVLLVDDLPHDFWPEVTEGNWQSGISEDASMQMVWHAAEPIFTIRTEDAVDPEGWSFKPDDRLLRLWTMDVLRLTARLAGLSGPEHREASRLLVFRNAADT